MSYLIMDDVQDHAPRDLTAGELGVLMAIARAVKKSDADAGRRRAAVSHKTIAWRARTKVGSVTILVARLVEKGALIRVPIDTDKHGGPVYTTDRKVPIYELSTFEADPDECPCYVHETARETRAGATVVAPEDAAGTTRVAAGATRVAAGATRVAPSLVVRTTEERVSTSAPPPHPPDADRFEAFVAAYPRKGGREATKRARALFVEIIASGAATADQLIAEAKRVEAKIAAAKDPDRERDHTFGPDTWLKNGEWKKTTRKCTCLNDPCTCAGRAPAPPSYEALHDRADAATAARLIRKVWIEPERAPSDPDSTPHSVWVKGPRREFIEAHREQICAAIRARDPGRDPMSGRAVGNGTSRRLNGVAVNGTAVLEAPTEEWV